MSKESKGYMTMITNVATLILHTFMQAYDRQKRVVTDNEKLQLLGIHLLENAQ